MRTSQEIWKEVLDAYCPSVEFINEWGEIEELKPCDLGSYCDRCQHDKLLDALYQRKLREEGVVE